MQLFFIFNEPNRSGAGAKKFGCLQLEPEPEIWVSAPQSWFQLLRTLPLVVICKFFKAGCKSVSLSLMAFPPVLFISRLLRYLLRMCSTWLKLAQQHISSETSVVILS